MPNNQSKSFRRFYNERSFIYRCCSSNGAADEQPAAAQKKNQVRLDIEDVQTIQLPKGALHIQRVVHSDRISPAGELPDPYLYVQSNFLRWAPTGLANLSLSSPTTAPVGSIADDVVLFGGAAIDPNFDTIATVAMASEFTALLFNPGPGASSGTITLSVHPWIGAFGSGALAASHTSPAITYTALPAGSLLLLVYEPAEPVAMTKGSFIRLNIVPDIGNPMLGWIITDSTPGNVSMMPGRGYFRRDPLATAGSVFTGLSQVYSRTLQLHRSDGLINLVRACQTERPACFAIG